MARSYSPQRRHQRHHLQTKGLGVVLASLAYFGGSMWIALYRDDFLLLLASPVLVLGVAYFAWLGEKLARHG